MNGADRHHGRWRVDRHAAAVQVVQTDNAVYIRVSGQQVTLNDLHDIIHDARHAVYAGGDAEQIFGADAAIRVAVAFKRVAFQRRQRFRHFRRQRQGV